MIASSSILLFLTGLILVAVCSDFLVDGASDIARRSGVSEFVIGLTIVGIGTSMPEMVVSFLGAFRGNADIAIGNVIGSNIFNTFLILGVTSIILPIPINKDILHKDIPFYIAASLLLIFTGMSQSILKTGQDTIGRGVAAIMLISFAAYLFLSFKEGNAGKTAEEEKKKEVKFRSAVIPVFMTIGGLGGLIFGGRLFVDGATMIAESLGWSDKFIAVTILAGGTSLPELATCVVAAIKHKGQLALGNIIGSNIANILLIVGGSALIQPLSTSGISLVDMGVLLLSAISLPLVYFLSSRKRLGRLGGTLFLIVEVIYMYLLINEL